MFGDGQVTGANDGRYNVLLLGGDSGAGRWGLRPDSLTVASIDAVTGRTVLISLPRNMARFPFADGSVMDQQFPHGFNCDGCYLNAVSTWAQDHTDLFGKSDNPGVDATVSAVEGITGLKMNYWAMVNLEGFKDLVDAVGGVTLNVREPIPVGGLGSDVTGYIQPGVRKLDGHDTLWFARSREGSDDYSRMARQKCVMNAMLQQVSPQAALRNFQSIAKASSEMLSTNIPSSEVDRFIALALRARQQRVASLSLVPPMINTGDPDIDLVQEKVAAAIDEAEGQAPPPSHKARKKPQAVTGASVGSLSEGYAANQADDVGSAC
jgi:LCP family protein required for cell wall assembly